MGFSLYDDMYVFSENTIAAYCRLVPGIEKNCQSSDEVEEAPSAPKGWMIPGIYSWDVEELVSDELSVIEDHDAWSAFSKTPREVVSDIGLDPAQFEVASFLSLFDPRGVVICRDGTHAGLQSADEIAVMYQKGIFVFAAIFPCTIAEHDHRKPKRWESGCWVEYAGNPIWDALKIIDSVFETFQPYNWYLPRSTGYGASFDLKAPEPLTEVPGLFATNRP